MRVVPVPSRANFEFLELESPETLADLAHFQGIFDLDQVLIITGFVKLGSWGNSGKRCGMEAYSEFNIGGCIEMARIMGYIKRFDSKLESNNLYVDPHIPPPSAPDATAPMDKY